MDKRLSVGATTVVRELANGLDKGSAKKPVIKRTNLRVNVEIVVDIVFAIGFALIKLFFPTL